MFASIIIGRLIVCYSMTEMPMLMLMGNFNLARVDTTHGDNLTFSFKSF